MWKIILKFLFISLFLIPACVVAVGVDVSLSKNSLSIYTSENETLEITVKNMQNIVDSFSISVFPPHPGILTSLEKYYVTLNPGESEKVKIHFKIAECSEEKSFYFFITVGSLTNREVSDSELLILDVMRRHGICIYSFNLSETKVYPGSNISIEVTLMNPSESVSQPVYLETTILFKNEIIKKFQNYVEAVGGKGIEIVKNILEISKYQDPGKYTVEILLKDKYGLILTRKETEFAILTLNASEKTEFLPISKKINYGLLSQTVEIVVRNEGNVPIENFYLSERIPVFMKVFFFPSEKPNFEETKESMVIYYWHIPYLAPGSSYTISYQISTLNAVLIAIVLIIVIVYSFTRTFSIRLIKRHVVEGPLTKEKEITIMLEVRNRTRHEIKDVIVRDFVPSMATVVEKFDTLRPTLRRVANGTELVWKIPSLAPGDERVLTYRIKPILEIVGKLRLPKAYMKFMDKKKEVRKVLSKSAYIKAG
ncbi:MAG: hypothetical protein QW472_03575 [Candidatus Aenigmatarchaeota archaeon]